VDLRDPRSKVGDRGVDPLARTGAPVVVLVVVEKHELV
jgi:hypothetical protein